MKQQISLKDFVKDIGIKQYKIAEILGVRTMTVSSWVNGQSKPDIQKLRAIELYTNGIVGLYSPWGDELKSYREKKSRRC